MLYQLSYASPAQTDRIYRSGHEIASRFPEPQQNPCQQATYVAPIRASDALLGSRLRKFRVAQLHVVMHLAERQRVRRITIGLTPNEWNLHAVDVAIIVEVFLQLRHTVGVVILADHTQQQSAVRVEIHFLRI